MHFLTNQVADISGYRLLADVIEKTNMADEILDIEVARNKMKEWRDEPPRNSEEVIELGESLIVEHGSKLGDECMFY